MSCMKVNGHVELDCAVLGWQEVLPAFKEGRLVSLYFLWDTEKKKNLVLGMSRFDVEDIEREQETRSGASRIFDPMTLAKNKFEEEMK